VMLGRAAYHEPALLGSVDRLFYGAAEDADPLAVMEAMIRHAERETARGLLLHRITRHMLGLFHGRPGARRFRQILTVDGAKRGAGADVMRAAMAAVSEAAAIAA